MRWGRALFAMLAACAITTSTATGARAQAVVGKDVARKLFDEGVELERRGDLAAALAKFDEAAKIVVTPGLRFHQGYVHELQGRLAAALEDYEAALRLARELGKPEVERATAARLEPLRPRVPTLAVRVPAEAQARVRLDDKDLPEPLLDGRPLRVDPGEHTVTATAPGRATFTRKVQAREGQSAAIDVVFAERDGPAEGAAPPTEPPREEPRRRSLALPIAVTTGAVALATTGVVTFLLAGSAQRDAEATCPTRLDCEDERSRVRALDAVALAGFASAAGLGVLAVVLWTSAPGRVAARATSTRLVAGPGTVGLEGVLW